MAIVDFLSEWQTLIAALIALAAAMLTVRAMRDQAAADEKRFQLQLKRKEQASRALMPDALNDICRYTEEVGQHLAGRRPIGALLPTEALATLKQVIEHIETSAAKRTFELVSKYQVHRARLSGSSQAIQPSPNPDHLYDAVLLRAYANSLFDYARNNADTVGEANPPYSEMITASANVFTRPYLMQYADTFSAMNKLIQTRHDR